VFRCGNFHADWFVGAAGDFQKHAAAIEEAALQVEIGAAHREIKRVHPVMHLQPAGLAGVERPAVFVGFGHGNGRAVGLSMQADNMASKLAQQIAAGNPAGQTQGEWARGQRLDGQGDVKIVCGRVGHAQAVMQGVDHGGLVCT
jgi:hypothetical protein